MILYWSWGRGIFYKPTCPICTVQNGISGYLTTYPDSVYLTVPLWNSSVARQNHSIKNQNGDWDKEVSYVLIKDASWRSEKGLLEKFSDISEAS